MYKFKFIITLIFIFNCNLCLAQELVLYNATNQSLLALYMQDSNLDVQPKDLLEGKTLGANAGVKLQLEGNLSSMDIGIIDVNGIISTWENNDLTKLNKVTITPNLSLDKE